MRTIIKLTMTGVVLMAATSLFAETDGATALDFSADSAYSQIRTNDAKSYHFGKREVIFDDNGIHIMKDRDNFDQSFDDDNFRGNQGGYTPQTNNNGNTSNQNGGNSSSKHNKYRYFSPNLSSIDFGVSQFASNPLSFTIDDAGYMDLKRGFHLSACLDAAGLPIISRRLGIAVGVGVKCDFYTFATQNLALEKVDGRLVHYADTSKSYKKSKLTNTYLTVPVVIEVHAKDVWLMAGVEGNLLAWSNTKLKTSSGHKDRVHSNFCQNLFSYNLVAKIGVDCVGAYVRANMSPLFSKDKGPELYPYSAGISLTF
ncbi:MAG: outer membrane beta-barrel protein [Salinivirgaceae bacterium]|nr:outer membrane beta-barrel protein [Salinivirgaceae bacterium]